MCWYLKFISIDSMHFKHPKWFFTSIYFYNVNAFYTINTDCFFALIYIKWFTGSKCWPDEYDRLQKQQRLHYCCSRKNARERWCQILLEHKEANSECKSFYLYCFLPFKVFLMLQISTIVSVLICLRGLPVYFYTFRITVVFIFWTKLHRFKGSQRFQLFRCYGFVL